MPEKTPVHVQPDGRTFHVFDRRTEIREWVHREVLRNALGESFRFDVVPVVAADGTAVEVGYMLYLSTPCPVPIGTWVSAASRPFEFNATEEFTQTIVRAVMGTLRKTASEALRLPQTS
jgi:hypothetical protein